eukprot:371008-Prymnesium_polylepis.1
MSSHCDHLRDHLLTPARAAEHALHAIAEGREDLLTPGIWVLMGSATLEDAEPPLSITHWCFGGHTFAKSGTAAALGVAAVVTAPLEIPTLLYGGAALAINQGLSFLTGASEELARAQEEERFRVEYGFARTELKVSWY